MQNNSRFAVAIHILTVLAYRYDELVTSEFVARSVNTNPVVIRRTLGGLRRAGLVSSQPGVLGGWRLTRPPSAITLKEVHAAMTEELPFGLPAQSPNAMCPIGKGIQGALIDLFQEVEIALQATLERTTLEEVLMRLKSAPCKRAQDT